MRPTLIEKERNIELHLSDVGTGISQILPIIVANNYYKNYYITIQQPELHLHPAQQTELGDLFISTNNINVVETHSEHLMLRLLKRIRENNLSTEEISVNVFDIKGGFLLVKKIKIDDSGEFDEWPNGFFEERINEVL